MNIAICDDDNATAQQLAALAVQVCAGTTWQCKPEVFCSGDSLLHFLEQSPRYFDMYLLDIEMQGTDGLETARRIRRTDQDAVLVFVTGHKELMAEAFRVLAFGYILKPFWAEEIADTLLSAIHLLECRRILYLYTTRKKKCALRLAQIEYIESRGHKVIIHTVDGAEAEHYGTLKDAAKQVEGDLFAQAHQSFLINLEQIKELDSQTITMQNGAVIRISSTHHADFHSKYRRFVLMHAKGEGRR